MSTPPPTAAELEKERLGLLYLIGLPAPDSDVPGATLLSGADPAVLHSVLNSPLESWEQGLCPFAAAPILDLLMGSEKGKQAILESDIALLSEVFQQRADHVRVGAFGLRDAAFPLEVGGRVIHCTWVRGYRTSPFSSDELSVIAETTGRPLEEVTSRAADCPILTAHQEAQLHEQASDMRTLRNEALDQHLQQSALTLQLTESAHTRALGTLSGGVAHRFNNLLSIILGYASFVLNREELSSEATDAVGKISDAAQEGRRLTEEILAFGGSEVEQETPCPVHDMLCSILSLLQSQYASKVSIHTSLNAEQQVVTAPASSIHQLVYDLLTSAVDGISETNELQVTSTNLIEDDISYLSLSIIDPGTINEEGDDGGINSFNLSQADGIVGSLDGSIIVHCEPGQPSSVEIRLPVSTAAPAAPIEVAQSTRLEPAAIWIVDDDAIFRDMCEQVLGDEGHSIALMESGSEMQALWAETQIPPELMIIDFSMPEYNGLELTEWLRDQGIDVPIILVSGFSETQPDIHKALQYRKTHFLRKPFSFREMIDSVTVALGESLLNEK